MTSDKKIHLIGNAHIDPVWLWRWQEGFAEIKATFASALERMKEFPEFIFTCACASYYQWVEENCPEMFEEIKQRVAQGRWVIVGGWWLQPDCNMPSGESFVRHGLLSQRYFLQKLGITARVGYNVDSFGHSGMLPQILKKSGMDYYVFMRPDASENKEVPGSLFWWESEDGSRVMAYRIPTQYGPWGWPGMPESDMPIEKVKILETGKECEKQGIDLMGFYGVGNHGGGPTIANLRLLRQMREELGEAVLVMSSPNRYFEEMSKLGLELPIYHNDLQMHAKGCYSTMSEIKKNNRLSENRLITAEKFSAVACSLLPFCYPGEKLKGAWEKVLFNHFHDVLCGCSIKEAYQDARESHGEALNIGATVLNAATQRISWAIDTLGGEGSALSKEGDWMYWETENRGSPLVVFNPLSWAVDAPVALSREAAGVTDECGNAVEIQKIEVSDVNNLGKYNTLFMASLPPIGYRTYWVHLRREMEAAAAQGGIVAGSSYIENDFLRLEIEPHTGYAARLYDKKNGVEVLNGKGCVPLVVDMSQWDTWAHGATEFRDVMARFTDAEVRLMESGPLRARLRAISRYNRSTLVQDFILYRDRSLVEVHARLDWQERTKMLKLSFPVNVASPAATWEIPYGTLTRPADGQEAVGQAWMDLTGTTGMGNGQYGVSILNDCKYASDIKGCEMRLTVANSSIYADHFAKGRSAQAEVMDQGVQEFRYMIVPHIGSWRDAETVKRAWELNTNPIQVAETYHRGPLPQHMSGIRISCGNVIASAFKRAEDGNGYILRCYETSGQEAEAAIELPLLGRKWMAHFGGCEIKTYFISDDPGADVCEKNLLEM